MRLLGLAALFGAFPVTMIAQTARLTDVDRFVATEMARTKTPGVAVAIIDHGRVVVAKGYGYANVEHHVPVDRETIFESGSMGKQFTAAAVMLLVEAGRIGLDDPITKYFPDAPARWHAIAVRNLLTHTSGIPDYEGAANPAVALDLRRDYTEDELRHFAYQLDLEFPPGARWHYSNTGYVLLGILIHKVSGQFYGDFLHDHVFVPLGMKTTRIISEADIVPHRAAGYRLVDGVLENQEWVAPQLNTTADGSLYFSITDLIAWDRGLRSGAILSAPSWKQVNEPVTLTSGRRYPYGFGWGIDTVHGRPLISHGGSWQGFKTYIARYLGPSLTVLVLANSAATDPGRLAAGIAAAYQPALAPPELGPIADQEPATRARLDSLLVQARDGRLSPGELAYVGSAFFPTVAKEYQARLKALGTAREIVPVERKALGDDQVATFEVRYPGTIMIATIGIAPDDKISIFTLQPKLPPVSSLRH